MVDKKVMIYFCFQLWIEELRIFKNVIKESVTWAHSSVTDIAVINAPRVSDHVNILNCLYVCWYKLIIQLLLIKLVITVIIHRKVIYHGFLVFLYFFLQNIAKQVGINTNLFIINIYYINLAFRTVSNKTPPKQLNRFS